MLNVGTTLTHLSFDSTGSYLFTDVGNIAVNPLPQSQAMPLEAASLAAATALAATTTAKFPAIKQDGYGLSLDGFWITRDG